MTKLLKYVCHSFLRMYVLILSVRQKIKRRKCKTKKRGTVGTEARHNSAGNRHGPCRAVLGRQCCGHVPCRHGSFDISKYTALLLSPSSSSSNFFSFIFGAFSIKILLPLKKNADGFEARIYKFNGVILF